MTTDSEPLVYTIQDFADAHHISRATMYNMWRAGGGPAKMQVMGRVLISREAAREWRKSVEGAMPSSKIT